MSASTSPTGRPPGQQDNLWLNLGFNAIIPAFLLAFASKESLCGPFWGLIVALAFPVGYGLWVLVRRRTWNLFSVLGFTSILLTGGLGLMKVDGFWFAVKEAAVPMLLGLAVPLSLRTSQPLVRTLLYNDQVLDTARIGVKLEERGAMTEFNKLLAWASWMLAAAMFVSAITNFGLALWLLPSESGTSDFNAQLGKLQFWSWPVTMVPTGGIMFVALFKLMKGLEELTGLEADDLFHAKPAKGGVGAPPTEKEGPVSVEPSDVAGAAVPEEKP